MAANDSRPIYLRPKHWDSFQHYKRRRPPWIKLHRDLLDDYDFSCLQDASKALAPLVWLLCSECDGGGLLHDSRKIAFRLHMTESKLEAALKPLIKQGFIVPCYRDASGVLAECQQHAIPETEAETEAEKKKNPKKKKIPKPEPTAPAGLNLKAWADYVKYRRQNKIRKLSGQSETKAQNRLVSMGDEAMQREIIEQTIANGWTGLFALNKRGNGKPAATIPKSREFTGYNIEE